MADTYPVATTYSTNNVKNFTSLKEAYYGTGNAAVNELFAVLEMASIYSGGIITIGIQYGASGSTSDDQSNNFIVTIPSSFPLS